jgi:DNA-binding MarR family transcriptional regulator
VSEELPSGPSEEEPDPPPAGELASAAGELARLDRVVHEPARLAILAILAVVQEAEFTFVRQQAGLTGGNLASHLAKLEDAGLVRVRKGYEGRRPVTTLALTPAGRAALEAWRGRVGRWIDLLP